MKPQTPHLLKWVRPDGHRLVLRPDLSLWGGGGAHGKLVAITRLTSVREAVWWAERGGYEIVLTAGIPPHHCDGGAGKKAIRGKYAAQTRAWYEARAEYARRKAEEVQRASA
jgi:hypothetical protein